MRISDWSSDGCSYDLCAAANLVETAERRTGNTGARIKGRKTVMDRACLGDTAICIKEVVVGPAHPAEQHPLRDHHPRRDGKHEGENDDHHPGIDGQCREQDTKIVMPEDRKSIRLNSSHK